MSLPPLTVIPAGAGSGKTHHIQHQLADWVAKGRIAPERIAAVTFTEAAAAELRERISATLLASGQIEAALRLDQAYISTIHGFGLRVLSEFAFECGTSPQPRLLSEEEQDALLRRSLSRTDKADAITADLSAYGYAYNWNTSKGPEDGFRDDLLRIIALLRALGWRGEDPAYASAACQWIADRYGPTVDARTLEQALHKRVKALLKAFPDSLEQDYGTKDASIRELRRDFINLKRAHETDALGHDWGLWQALRGLRQSKRGTPLPEDYDRLSTAVMEAAGALPTHPGPLQHAQTHLRALLAAGQAILDDYAQAKRAAGLVDYSDMVALAEALLRDRPEVLTALKERIDCLVVDEFQDTNPNQFALLWQLTQAGVPTIVVGDLKQAIMGFQGADARLFEALIAQQGYRAQPLDCNWRSQPALVELVNAIGAGLFPGGYQPLTPQRTRTQCAPLEVVQFRDKARRDQHAVRAFAVAQRLQALLADSGQNVIDRRTGQPRRLRGGDIGVLCPTHGMLGIYAQVLREQGLRVRETAAGWWQTRPVQLLWHALDYVADPDDRHAALYLAVTELGSLTLQDALEHLLRDGAIDEPLLVSIEALSKGAATRPIDALVADVIADLGLYDKLMHWPDAEQARANLLRFQGEAAAFLDAHPDSRAQAGLFGAGVPSFLAWLGARVDGSAGDGQPDPRVIDEDAIELCTWHAAKGREWPLVVAAGLERKVGAKLPDMGLGYASFDDLDQVLAQARIEYAPRFAAGESNDQFLPDLQSVQEMTARRLLYVILTRARDKLILEWPAYLDGKDTTTHWEILRQEGGLLGTDKGLRVGKKTFPCLVTQGPAERPEVADDSAPESPTALPAAGRRAIQADTPPAQLTPDSLTPSQMGGPETGPETALETGPVGADTKPIRVKPYGPGLTVAIGLPGAERGTFIHRCFEVLGARPDLKAHLPAATGVPVDAEALERIAEAVAAFEAWLQAEFQPTAIRREWPLAALDARGTLVTGTADLVVETDQGCWVIDHKSDRVDDPIQGYQGYRPQLSGYAKALSATGQHVLGTAIHWTQRGDVVLELW